MSPGYISLFPRATKLTGFTQCALICILCLASLAGKATTSSSDVSPPQHNKPADSDSSTELVHASLPTDPNIQSAFQRARRFVRDEQYELAARHIHTVMHADKQIMVRVSRRSYRPAHQQGEKLLKILPERGIRLYQQLVNTRASLQFDEAVSRRSPQLLKNVTSHYFFSSYGDDAAYRLACHRIDRGRYEMARRLLLKLLNTHPDPSIPRRSCYQRLLFLAHRQANAESVNKWTRKLSHLSGTEDFLDSVTRETSSPNSTTANRTEETSVSNQQSTSPHTAYPRFPPRNIRNISGLIGVWEQKVPDQTSGEQKKALMDVVRHRKWIQNGFRPTNRLIARGNRIWASSARGIICVRASDGTVIWRTSGTHPFQSSNQPPKSVFVHHAPVRHNWQETLSFHDRISGDISLMGNVAIRLEGNWKSIPYQRKSRPQDSNRKVQSRPGSNLVGYNATTGERMWVLGQDGPLDGCRFMNAPVDTNEHALTTYEDKDGLHLLALDPETGAILWRRFLCAYVSSPMPPTNPVGIAVENSRAFIASGKGVVFCTDALTGTVKWATTYNGRISKWQGPKILRLNRPPPKDSQDDGWARNTAFVTDNRCVVLPGDTSRILCLSSATGEVLYDHSEIPAGCYVGTHGQNVLTLANGFLRSYSLKTGKVQWRAKVQSATGRPALAKRSVLVPRENDILRINANSGKRENRLAVIRNSQVPIGNLLHHNDRIYAGALETIYALSPGRQHLAKLNKRLRTKTDASLYLQRGLFFWKLQRYTDAITDLRKAYTQAASNADGGRYSRNSKDETVRKRARRALLKALLQHALGNPTSADDPLSRARGLAQSTPEKLRLKRTQAKIARTNEHYSRACGHYLDMARIGQHRLLPGRPTRSTHRINAASRARSHIADILSSVHDPARHKILERMQKTVHDLATATNPPEWQTFYYLWRSLPSSGAAATAGIQAARRAENSGRIAQAEMILVAMTNSNHPQVTNQSLLELGRFYERREWYQHASTTYKRLAGRDTNQKPATTSEQDIPRDVAERAVGRLESKRHGDGSLPSTTPLPPLKLLRKTAIAGSLLRQHTRLSPLSPHLADHVYRINKRQGTLTQTNIRSGETVWNRRFKPSARCRVRGHLLYSTNKEIDAISLLNGQTLWSSDPTFDVDAVSNMHIHTGTNVVIATGRLSRENYLVNAIDIITGRPRWTRIFTQEHRPTLASFENCLLDMSGLVGKRPMSVYSPRSGRKLTSDFPPPAKPHFWSRNGYVTKRGKKLVFHSLPDGRRAWEIPLKLGDSVELRPIRHSPSGLVITDNTVAIIDPSRQKIIWKSIDSGPGSGESLVSHAGFLPRLKEYALVERGDSNARSSDRIRFIDKTTGEVKSETRIPGGYSVFNHNGLCVSTKYVLLKRTDRTGKESRNRFAFLNREDGTVRPAPTFLANSPPGTGPQAQSRTPDVWITGDLIIAVTGKTLGIYGRK